MISRTRSGVIPLLGLGLRGLVALGIIGLIILMGQLLWQRVQSRPAPPEPLTLSSDSAPAPRQVAAAPDFGEPEALPRPQPVSIVDTPPRPNMTTEEMFRSAAAPYNLDWQIVAELAYQESLMNPLALGRDNDMGLMQIIPATWNTFAPQVGVDDPFDAYSSALVGAAYLAYMRDFATVRGHPEMYWAVIGYNWGPNNLENLWANNGDWADVPPTQQNYALKILQAAANGAKRWQTYDIPLASAPN